MTEPAVPNTRPLRIVYAAGPGHVANTYLQWKQGQADTTQVSHTYSGQFLELCRAWHAQALVIASNDQPALIRDPQFTIRHRPIPWQHDGALGYHLGQIYNGLRIIASVLRFHADVLVIAEGTHWILLLPLAACGVKIIPTLHCTFWPAGNPPVSRFQRFLSKTTGFFWRHAAAATICISPECERQVLAIAHRPHGPILQARARYDPDYFLALPPPPPSHTSFRLLFTGRIEQSKGIFDLLEMARQLEALHPGQFKWDIRGTGGTVAQVQQEIKRLALENTVTLYGHCNRDVMLQAYSQAHAVVVPTTTKFAEGLNRAVIEAVLAGRPVVTSPLTNCRDVLGPAVLEVPPENIDAYCAAILQLASDRQLYDAQCRAGIPLREQFFDPQRSWGAALNQALTQVLDASRTRSLEAPPLAMLKGGAGEAEEAGESLRTARSTPRPLSFES